MAGRLGRINLTCDRMRRLASQKFQYDPSWQFVANVARLIWDYRFYSLAIFVVTIFQEFAALWPVNLLGDFVDRLESGNLGNIVWLFMAASAFYPALTRANIVLRHKMFYDTDMQGRYELVAKMAEEGQCNDTEAAGAAYTRAVNAVSGITNTAYHVLGSFTPVIIKIIMVAGRLLAYNQLLGWVYLGSLVVPTLMTWLSNKKLIVLRDSEYSVVSDVSGAGIKAISDRADTATRERFRDILAKRREIMMELLTKRQIYLYWRQAALVGSQFLVVFLALGLRERINITPGDFTKIVGYTTQVSTAYINAILFLDNILSYSRAYYIYARASLGSPKIE